ncbi:MAG: hypothetical protein R2838_24810 [Caldilineaceae bacterium]
MLVRLVDITTPPRRRVQTTYGLTGAQIGTDLAAMLGAVNPDVVFDCTVPPVHGRGRDRAGARLPRAGRKPMATSVADAQRINAACGPGRQKPARSSKTGATWTALSTTATWSSPAASAR